MQQVITQATTGAQQLIFRQRAACPTIHFPDNLPVSQIKQAIYDTIRDNQIVITAEEMSSDKITQLPKMCLELGVGIKGQIGHTQTCRLVDRAVGNRIADEPESNLGECVSYKLRFRDKVGENTLIKLMTDAILLTEIQHYRQLMQYDTLIIYEAREK